MPGKKFLGVFHKILVQGVGLGHQQDQRVLAPPSHAAAALPGRYHGARVTHQDTDIQPADVDPHLQGAGGNDPQHFAAGQLLFDFPAFFGQKTGSIRTDLFFKSGACRRAHRCISSVNFRAWVKQIVARPWRRDCTKNLAARAAELASGLINTKCRPDKGAPDSAITSTSAPVSFAASSSGLAMVAEARMYCGDGAVMAADPGQPPQDLGHVTSHNPLIGVDFIDDHEFQLRKKPLQDS